MDQDKESLEDIQGFTEQQLVQFNSVKSPFVMLPKELVLEILTKVFEHEALGDPINIATLLGVASVCRSWRALLLQQGELDFWTHRTSNTIMLLSLNQSCLLPFTICAVDPPSLLDRSHRLTERVKHIRYTTAYPIPQLNHSIQPRHRREQGSDMPLLESLVIEHPDPCSCESKRAECKYFRPVSLSGIKTPHLTCLQLHGVWLTDISRYVKRRIRRLDVVGHRDLKFNIYKWGTLLWGMRSLEKLTLSDVYSEFESDRPSHDGDDLELETWDLPDLRHITFTGDNMPTIYTVLRRIKARGLVTLSISKVNPHITHNEPTRYTDADDWLTPLQPDAEFSRFCRALWKTLVTSDKLQHLRLRIDFQALSSILPELTRFSPAYGFPATLQDLTIGATFQSKRCGFNFHHQTTGKEVGKHLRMALDHRSSQNDSGVLKSLHVWSCMVPEDSASGYDVYAESVTVFPCECPKDGSLTPVEQAGVPV